MGIFRAERIVPLMIVSAAVVLGASEFMIAFEFTPPGGEALDNISGGERHSYYNLVLAASTVLVMALTLASGSRPGAYAVAALGIVTLLLFLAIDLPDVGQRGDLRDPLRYLALAEFVPQAGFWLQAVGAVTMSVGSVMFAASYGQASGETGPRPGESRRDSSRRPRPETGEGDRPLDRESSPTG